MKIAIVNKQDLSIASWYVADAADQSKYGGPWGEPEAFAHVELDAELDSDAAKAELNEEDEIVLVEDEDKAAAKLQASRNAKLAALRAARDVLMADVDVMVNELALGDRADAVDVKAYRDALKEVPTPYRYVAEPERAKAAIDAIEVESFEWPEAPSEE